MKPTKLLVAAFVTLSSLPILAQQVNDTAQQTASAGAPGALVSESSSMNMNAIASMNAAGTLAQGSAFASGSVTTPNPADMRAVSGELVGKLDAKSAKVGDTVVVKTTQTARTADGIVIRKGSRLIGHVTEVQAHDSASQDSHVAIQFDRIEQNGGASMAIHSVIESVTPSAAATAMAEGNAEDSLGGGSLAGGVPSGGGRAGGGLVGGGGLAGSATGMAGNTARGLSTTAGAAGNAAGSAGSSVGAAGSAAGNAGATAGAGLHAATAGTGSLVAQPTGIPGLMLAVDASGSASGVLSASKKNVHLDSGTQIVFGVSSAVAQ